MENGQVWQELLPNDEKNKRCFTDEPSTPTGSNPDTDAPQLTVRSNTSKSLTKQYSLNGLSTYRSGTDGCSTPILRYGQAKIIQGRPRKRVVFKNGTVNLSKEHVSKRSQRYLQDIFTTLVDIQWRWNLLVFAMGFILSWLGFAVAWWVIAYAHGDFDHLEEEDWKPCMVNVRSFASAFLFSIETQHTIGYGSRYTTEECPEAIFIMCLQSITGLMIQCFMVGIVFAKLSRPKQRSQTLMFSRHSIICLRDGRLSLMFRVGDVRKSHIIGAKVSAQVIRRKQTKEGELIPYYHHELSVRFDAGGDGVLLIWPVIIVHEIDENSPFYGMCAEDMVRERYELVAMLEGTIESTGQAIQARTSYLPTEILWGHRFEQVISYRKESGDYMVDYGKFNSTYEVETPLCSAKDYYQYQKALAEQRLARTQNQAGHQMPASLAEAFGVDTLKRNGISNLETRAEHSPARSSPSSPARNEEMSF